MAVKKILMLVGDYVEDYEEMVSYQMLVMVGHTVRAGIVKRPEDYKWCSLGYFTRLNAA